MREKLKNLLGNVGFIIVVAFMARMIFLYLIFHKFEQSAVRDNIPFGAETGAVAAAIASGRGFSSPLRMVHTGPTAWFTPIYIYLLAGIFKLFGIFSYTSNLLIRTIDIAFASFACWPVCFIGKKIFGEKVGIFSAWVWAFLPAAIFYPVMWVWDTALTGLWMTLLFAVTLQLRGSDRRAAWIGYGVLWGIGAMINPSILSVLPFLGLWAVWPLRGRLKHAAQLAALSSAVFFACLVPWTVRNYVVFHELIPLRSNFGLELWLGNSAKVPGGWAPWLHPNDSRAEANRYAAMTELPYMAQKQREAWEFIQNHPMTTVSFIMKRFADTWLGVWDAPVDSWSRADLSWKLKIAFGCLFSLLSFVGVLFAYHEGNEAATPLGIVMLIFPVVFYITHSSARYRYPIDAIMGILATYAVAYPVSRWAKRRHQASNVPEVGPQTDKQASPATYETQSIR